MKKELDIIGVEMDLGASKRGVSMGPKAIRYGGLIEGLEEEGYTVNDKGDIAPITKGESRGNMKNFDQVVDINRKLYKEVADTMDNGRFPVVLGGDHSIAAGSITAVAERKNVGVIWIDAHGDWNDDKSSPSGNMHGMPFSAVCGYGPDAMVDYAENLKYVDVKHCVQIGGRDIDSIERVRMKEAGVTVFPINVIDEIGMTAVMRKAIEIAGEGTDGIHLSFDVDAITPEAAPGTGTIVHDGLTVREAFLAVEMLASSGKLTSIDMVEVNPILDIKNKTGILASELVQSALGKIVY